MVRRKFLSSSAARFVLYHPNSIFRSGQKYLLGAKSKMCAEVRVKYFFCIKISTRMLIRLWKSPVRTPLTSRPSTLFSSLHHLCATSYFFNTLVQKKNFTSSGNIFYGNISSDESRTDCSYDLPKPLILNDSRSIFFQYHLGGFSRCTLMTCFGSVMSSQRPYVFHPSATT